MRDVLAATLGVLALLADCTGPTPVEASVRDAFVACMEDAGFTVSDVDVAAPDGSHVERFTWEATGDGDPEQAGRTCEDEALARFEISRT